MLTDKLSTNEAFFFISVKFWNYRVPVLKWNATAINVHFLFFKTELFTWFFVEKGSAKGFIDDCVRDSTCRPYSCPQEKSFKISNFWLPYSHFISWVLNFAICSLICNGNFDLRTATTELVILSQKTENKDNYKPNKPNITKHKGFQQKSINKRKLRF